MVDEAQCRSPVRLAFKVLGEERAVRCRHEELDPVC